MGKLHSVFSTFCFDIITFNLENFQKIKYFSAIFPFVPRIQGSEENIKYNIIQ